MSQSRIRSANLPSVPQKRVVLVGRYLTERRGVGGAVASWLVRLTPGRAVWVRALAGDNINVLCSWASNFTLTVPNS